ncbi:MAG: double-strand break repair helicase AddA [Xanthobacteraceae bacterium]
MSARAEVPADTAERQERVSDPTVSAWVSANAGAGKTTVLVRRVIRLLLAGNPPARILCLTFTKAAAANMANKILETLSNWVRLDDGALDQAIGEVSALAPTPALRATARRLFAQALETPGGLKVQTIHAFCDRVLHQFPMEARVQAGFEVVDEVQEEQLLRRAREAVLTEAANDPAGPLGRALSIAVAAATDDSFNMALAESVRGRRKLLRLGEIGGETAVAEALGLSADISTGSIAKEILASPHLPRSEWETAARSLREGSTADRDLANRFVAAANVPDEGRLFAYLEVFLTGDGKLRSRSRFFTKEIAKRHPVLAERLDREFERMTGLIDRYRTAEALERTAALLTLATETIQRFQALKRARGALDYSDLIEKTADMLADTGAAWVLYKLDGGIDHVLIDEAQDTSPEQWSVIDKLTEEFFAGRGAREDRDRTIFVVGDEKQSIFSFQGAAPKKFGEMLKAFKLRVENAGSEFRAEKLKLSFRSARGVLEAVDTVFGRPEAFRGLVSADENSTIHEAIRTKAPALVEVWETEKPADDEEGVLPWDAPLDARSETSPTVKLAQRIASAVKFWTGGGLAIEDRKTRELRAPNPGDVIVLVRQRGPLFDAILQALKKADIPVAGADRLKLSEHIAVMDLMALGDALTLEADDLALACALKSPLFGLDEDDLYALAHGRAGTLAASLSARADENARFADTAQKLARWRKEASALRPFDFYSRVLGRDKGRERMLARLGHEAADAIDEFLARALSYERTETPTIAGFLNFLRRAGTEVKRDLEVESNSVRVMTVHGAKGLEAPLVVLADTTSIPDGRGTRLHDLPGTEAFIWAGKKPLDSEVEQAARLAADGLREQEYRRLLYVALTRAADALIVCGFESGIALKEGCWYRLVRDALEAGDPSELLAADAPYAKAMRWRAAPGPAMKAADAVPEKMITLAPWLTEAAETTPPGPRRLVPSQFDPDDEPRSPYAAAAPGALDPRRRGDLMHRLLQYLPDVRADARRDAAARWLARIAGDLPASDRAALAAEAMRVIAEPALAELFGPASRAEVDVLVREPDAEFEMFGRIDRLAVTADAILVADFKTGAPAADAADVPLRYVQQLAIYRDVLARVYPGLAMQALLVWTAGPAIHKIDAARLEAAMVEAIGKTAPG